MQSMAQLTDKSGVRSESPRLCHRAGVVLPCLLAPMLAMCLGGERVRAASHGAAPVTPPPPLPGEQLAATSKASTPERLTRELRRFDFEEFEHRPVAFPIDFYRLGDEASPPSAETVGGSAAVRGFPPFGWMGFANDHVKSGRWSLKFELEGGSMGAALTPRSVPIIPGGDYLLTAWVRTEGLRLARARVAAVVYDQLHRPLPGARFESELIDTRGAWMQVSLRVPAPQPEAASIAVELLLLQPGQWASRGVNPDVPVLEDLSGAVWFDDVAIWHVPRFDVRTSGGLDHGNVIVPPGEPELRIQVSDLSSEPLTVSVTVMDLFDRVVHQEAFQVASGKTDRRIALSGLRYGWYRASIDLNAARDWLGRDWVNFAFLPPVPNDFRTSSGAPRTFGIALDGEAMTDAIGSARLAADLGCSPVILPAWERSHTRDHTREAFEPLRRAAERLADAGGEVVFSLPFVPDELAASLRLRVNDVAGLFAADPLMTRPALERMLFVLGQRVQRWQIGPTGDDTWLWRDDLGARHTEILATLERLVPGPIVTLPWSIEFPPQSGPPVQAVSLRVPWRTPPEAIPGLLEAWKTERDVMLLIEPLPEREFTHDDRVTDLALRILHAKRAGAPRLVVAEPWKRIQPGEEPMPEPWFPAWIELGRRLDGRSFAGEVPLSRGIISWLFDGPAGPVLAVWNQQATGDDAILAEQLATDSVTVTDLMGNERVIPLEKGVHRIPLEGGRPVLISGIDSGLARFRQRFALTPASAPSTQREHHHELVLANPWGTTISGIVRIVEPQQWRFSPTRIPFTIAAGAEARLPFSLSFGPNELAGPKRVEAEVEFTSGQRSTFRVSAPFELGAAGLLLEPLWRVMSKPGDSTDDLLITAHITNTGDQPISLESFIRAPGYPRLSRTVARLGPGETTIRTFHLADGATTLAGQSIVVGLSEVDGPLRLNREIVLPTYLRSNRPSTLGLTREMNSDVR